MLELTDYIRMGINEQMVTKLILFDLSKAFDTVNHKILLTKQRKLNFGDTEIELFFSYLSNRSQTVMDEYGLT